MSHLSDENTHKPLLEVISGNLKEKVECIHGILTLCTLHYKHAARSIPCTPAFFFIFELLTIARSHVNTMCDFKRSGATKPIIGSC